MSVMEVFKAVVDADDAAGAALIDMVVYDYLADEAEHVRKDIEGMYAIVGLDRIQEAKRQLARSYVAKMVEGEYPDDTYLQAAEYLAGLEQYVSKALAWAGNGRWDVQEHPRDSRGRFSRKIGQGSVPLVGSFGPGSNRKMAPAVERATNQDKELLQAQTGDKKAVQDRLGQVQSQHEQAVSVANDFKRSLKGADAKDVEVQMLFMRDNNDVVERTFTLDQFNGKELPEGVDFGIEMNLVAMSVQAGRNASKRTQDAVGAYNLLGENGGATLASLAGVEPKRAKELAASLGMDYQPDSSKLSRFFGRLGAGGDVLSQVTGQEKLGQAVAFVGSVGPQAETALGPYAQRAAYRYRGTEQTPSQQLLGQFRNVAVMEAGAGLKADEGTKNVTPVEGFTIANSRRDLGPDSMAMAVRADVASAELARSLPKDPMLARLSELSGQVLPSQGILIDADGRVQSQSVGFTDDHYLPFDLKNLGALRGGQYARTRQSGGLTGEDIYTAVTMGARQVQVISPSGVFTLEMAPDFRGARGNSDKARGMYDRYLKILDAVENSDQYLMDISPKEKTKIKDDVRSLGYKDEEFTAEVDNRITEARRMASQVTEEDETTAHAKVMADMGLTDEKQITANGATARAFEDNYDDEIERIRSVKANRLRLNGEGYDMALRTLQQQFPAFIRRVQYRSLNEFVNEGGPALKGALPKGRQYSTDSGYAKPGSLRAQSVRGGFYERGPLQPGPKSKPGARAAAPEPTAPAAEAPPATQAEGEPPAAPAQPATTNNFTPARSALDSRLKAKLPQVKEAQDEATASLTGKIASVGFSSALGDTDLPIEQAIALDGPEFAAWFMGTQPSRLKSMMANPDAALAIATKLSDRDAVLDGFNMVLTSNGQDGSDFFARGGKIGDANVPAGDMAASAKWVADQAQTIADTIIMQMPYTAGSNPWHGSQPGGAVVAQEFDGMDRLTTEDQVRAYIDDAQNEQTWDDAKSLIVSGNGYRSLGEVGLMASKQVKALKMIDDLQKLNDDGILNTMNRKMVREALNVSNGIDGDLPTADDVINDPPALVEAIRKMPAKELAIRKQKAWSLAMKVRLIETLDRGDVVPFGDSRLLKSAARIEVLDSSHPLSLRVQARVSRGLPPV